MSSAFSSTVLPENRITQPGVVDSAKRSDSRSSLREGFFIEFASRAWSRVRKICPDRPPLILLTGGFRTRAGMAAAVAAGHTDLVGIGRPACLDPHIASRILDPAIPHAACADPPIPGTALWKTLVPVHLVGVGFSTVWWVFSFQLRTACVLDFWETDITFWLHQGIHSNYKGLGMENKLIWSAMH